MKNLWNKFTDKFGGTIFHPQFIMLSYRNVAIKEILKYAKGKNLIDIGCGRMPYRKELDKIVKNYTGVDHPKISKLYDSEPKPDILCDITKKIPVKNSTFDVAMMLEVLEYLENPTKTFHELKRILKPNGILIFTVPFLYPLHDVPYDRNRFTNTQIKTFLNNSDFKILKLKVHGDFLSFWFQSINVFLLKRVMDILKNKKTFFSLFYLIFLLTLTPIIVLVSNSIFRLTKGLKISKYPNYFPLDYLVVATKL